MGPLAVAAQRTSGLKEALLCPDAKALAITSAAMLGYSELVKLLAARRICHSVTARKLMHIGCGPIFLLCWPLFSSGAGRAATYAAMAPLSITAFFTLVGLGVVKDEATVRSMSRTGARRELLKGPFLYGTIIVAATLLFWRQLTAALTISCLCSGDGFADLVGRRLGHRHRIPWCRDKSWAGTGGFVVAAAATSYALVGLFQRQGWVPALAPGLLRARILGTTLASAAAETLPIAEGWDNFVVFVAALAADYAVTRRRGLPLS